MADADRAIPSLPQYLTSPRHNLLALGLGILVFAGLSTWASLRSEGFLEADACTHFSFARHALADPYYFTEVWGRPLCTGVYALPAALIKDMTTAVYVTRVVSLLMAIAAALVTFRIARTQGYRLPALAGIALLAMPLFWAHSFSQLTELPFALVIVLGLWAYQSKQFFWMALAASVAPTGRPEGFGILLIAAAGLLLHRRWYYLVLLPIPLILWTYLGWEFSHRPAGVAWYQWLSSEWPWAAKSAYGSGDLHHFAYRLPALVSPLYLPFLLLGIAIGFKLLRIDTTCQAPPPPDEAHRRRCQWVILLLPLSIFIVHSLLWWRGLSASSGYTRYLLCVAPLWALITARGMEWACWRFQIRAPFLLAAVLASAPVLVNKFYTVVPVHYYDPDRLGLVIARWYRSQPHLEQEYPRVMATSPWVYYFLDRSKVDQHRSTMWIHANAVNPPAGTILFWDETYGPQNSDAKKMIDPRMLEELGWVKVGDIAIERKWEKKLERCWVYLWRQTAQGRRPDVGRYTLPSHAIK